MTVRTAQEPGTRCVTLAHVVESLVGIWAEDNSVSCPGLTTLGGASWPGFAEGCIPEKPRGALRKPRLLPPVGSSILSGGPWVSSPAPFPLVPVPGSEALSPGFYHGASKL